MTTSVSRNFSLIFIFKAWEKNTEHSKNSIQEGFGDHFTWYYQYSLHLQITLVKQKKVTLIFSELVKWKIIRKKNLQLKDKPWHASKRFPWKIHVGFFIQAYYILKESDKKECFRFRSRTSSNSPLRATIEFCYCILLEK